MTTHPPGPLRVQTHISETESIQFVQTTTHLTQTLLTLKLLSKHVDLRLLSSIFTLKSGCLISQFLQSRKQIKETLTALVSSNNNYCISKNKKTNKPEAFECRGLIQFWFFWPKLHLIKNSCCDAHDKASRSLLGSRF